MCCDPVGVTEHVPGRKCLPTVHVGGVERGPMDTPFAQHRHLVQVPPTTVDIQAGSLSGPTHLMPGAPPDCDNHDVPRHAQRPLGAGLSQVRSSGLGDSMEK